MAKQFTVSTKFAGVDNVSSVVKKISGSVAGMQKHMEHVGRVAGRMGGLLKGAVMGLAVGAAGKALSDFAERGDEIARTSRMLGMTAENFQKLGYAAKMGDVPIETMTGAFKKLNYGLAQLTVGAGPMMDIIKHGPKGLGEQLRKTHDSYTAFMLVSDAIQKTGDAQVRAAIAQTAFGKAGQALLPMLMDGSEGLKKLGLEAENTGIIMSGDMVGSAEALDDSLKRVKASLMMVANSALAPIAKAITPVLEGFNKWIGANKEMISQNLSKVFKVIGDVFSAVGPSIVKIIEQLLPAIQQIINRALPVLVKLLDSLLPILPPLLDCLGPVLDIFEALAPAIEAAAELIKAILVPALLILKPILQLLSEILKPIVAGISAVGGVIGKLYGGPLGALASKMNPAGVAAYAGGPISPNAGMAAGGGPRPYNTTVDVRFRNPPTGTSIRQANDVPGFTLNPGMAGAAH